MDCESCEYYDVEEGCCGAFECFGLECAPLPCEDGSYIKEQK